MEEIHESECVEQFSSCYEDARITEQTSNCDEASNHHDHCGDWWDLKTEDTTDVEHNVNTICDIKLEMDEDTHGIPDESENKIDEIKLEMDEDTHEILDESETKNNEILHIARDAKTSSIFVTGLYDNCSSFQAMDIEEFADNDEDYEASVSNGMDYEESPDSGIGNQHRIDKRSSRSAETNVILDHSYARNEGTQFIRITDESIEDKCKIVSFGSGDPDVISVCEQCNKSFSSSDEYTSHQLSHHVHETQLKQSSSIGTVTFPNSEMPKTHMTQMLSECIEDKTHFCSVCSEIFSTDQELKSHMKCEHYEYIESKFCCSMCQMIFKKKKYLEQHEKRCINKLYCCSMCNERFATDVKFKSHLRYQHRHSQFSCSLCPKIFRNEQYLRKHMSTHKYDKLNDVILQCPSCNQQFKSVASLTDHKIKEHIHQCAYCLQKFLSYESLASHIQEKHDKHNSTAENDTRLPLDGQNSTLEEQTEQVLKMENCMCPKCDKQFTDAQGLKMHMIKYANDQKVKCPLCGKGFHTECKLQSHLEVEKDVGYLCAICHESVIHTELKRHKKTHTVCPLCGKKFISDGSLNQHTMIKECSCGEIFASKCMLQKHRFEKSLKDYQCPVCGEHMLHKDLKRHLIIRHRAGSSYQCQLCKKILLSSAGLKHHTELCSSKKQTDSTVNFRFKCYMCGYVCLNERSFMEHIKHHTELCSSKNLTDSTVKFRFKCYVCGYVCLDESSLMEHIKSKRDELHPCPTCGEGISHNNMASHRTSHKLHCTICGEQFSDTIKLKEHSKTHRVSYVNTTPTSRQLDPPVATQTCAATAQLAAPPMMEGAQSPAVTMRECPSLLLPCLDGAQSKKKKVPTATLR